MVKVFIGGSQSIRKLPTPVAARIDNIVERDFTVLIGDANGADTCVQKYLAEKGHAYALVFCTGVCRNNVGGWKTVVVSANAGERGFDFYALKDREMAREVDYGFMVWDGRSKGTLWRSSRKDSNYRSDYPVLAGRRKASPEEMKSGVRQKARRKTI